MVQSTDIVFIEIAKINILVIANNIFCLFVHSFYEYTIYNSKITVIINKLPVRGKTKVYERYR